MRRLFCLLDAWSLSPPWNGILRASGREQSSQQGPSNGQPPWPVPGAPSCLRKAWQKTLAEGLTEGWEGMDKATEGKKYQGRGQENWEWLALAEPQKQMEGSLGLFAGCWAGPSRSYLGFWRSLKTVIDMRGGGPDRSRRV